jgi:POT family proton-dependent oligopeptide transporter
MGSSSTASSVAEQERSVPPRGYRTAPDQDTTAWPPGIPYIIGNEACERFSFYGMRAILMVHLTALYVVAGATTDAANTMATYVTHLFFAGVYALPMIGALVADRFAGKYSVILYLSLVYCAGTAVLALGANQLMWMYVGLALIAVGSGGIKPCVSANVGDQFGKNNWFRVRTIFQIFYFSINFGSFFATLLIPFVRRYAGTWLLERFPGTFGTIPAEQLGACVAFGIPGVLMLVATLFFWAGRKQYVHVPPRPGGKLGMLDALSSICLFLAFGHLFFTADLHPGWGIPDWAFKAAVSALFLVLGLVVFRARQKIAPDDGFLAISLYALGRVFSAKEENAPPAVRPAELAVGDGIMAKESRISQQQAGYAVPPGDVLAGRDVGGESPLEQHWFWGPAARRFGAAAADGPVAVLRIISVFLLVAVFWALFDQHSSTWIRQAQTMDLTVWGTRLEASQIPALNPLMVMILIPLMNVVYSLCDKAGIRTTPLRRMTVGMLLTALSFAAAALLQAEIDRQGPGTVSVAWQIIPYLLLTIGEVMVSVTGLEFAYTQAPRRMKSTVMGFWLLTVTLGNILTATLARFAGLKPVDFFWVFAGLMAAATVLFGLRGYFYVEKSYPQEG